MPKNDISSAASVPQLSMDYHKSKKVDAPWLIVDPDKYPNDWQNAEFIIAKTKVKGAALQSLMPSRFTSDVVVEAFLEICAFEQDMREPLIFNTFFITCIMKDRVGFYEWAAKCKAWSYDV